MRSTPETTRSLEALARRHDATLFMLLLAAVQTLLGRYAGQDDVVLGSPIANRTRAEIEPLIGFFVNTLVLRGDLAGDPAFGELVARSRRAALEAYSHQDLPFERLVEELRPERRLSHNPLFQVMFAVQNAPLGEIDLPGLTFSPAPFEFPATRFDLEIFFTERRGGARGPGHLRHRPVRRADDRAPGGSPGRPARRRSLADPVTAAVGAVDPRRRPSATSSSPSGTTRRRSSRSEDVAALFAEQARRRPEAVAVAAEEGELTYAELDRRSSRLARRLAAAGVGPEVRVALLAQRSPALIVGLLGILKAGGAYVPLDPSYPAERLAWMLADSGSRVLLGQPELLAELPEGAGAPDDRRADRRSLRTFRDRSPGRRSPEGLAYVMYTSGSTGRPKGVGVTHRNVVRLVRESGFADLGAGAGLPATGADLLRRLDPGDLGAAAQRRAARPLPAASPVPGGAGGGDRALRRHLALADRRPLPPDGRRAAWRPCGRCGSSWPAATCCRRRTCGGRSPRCPASP